METAHQKGNTSNHSLQITMKNALRSKIMSSGFKRTLHKANRKSIKNTQQLPNQLHYIYVWPTLEKSSGQEHSLRIRGWQSPRNLVVLCPLIVAHRMAWRRAVASINSTQQPWLSIFPDKPLRIFLSVLCIINPVAARLPDKAPSKWTTAESWESCPWWWEGTFWGTLPGPILSRTGRVEQNPQPRHTISRTKKLHLVVKFSFPFSLCFFFFGN